MHFIQAIGYQGKVLKVFFSDQPYDSRVTEISRKSFDYFDDNFMCPYDSVIDMKSAIFTYVRPIEAGPEVNTDSYSVCSKTVDAEYMDHILTTCNRRDICSNLRALSTKLHCNGNEVYSNAVTLQYGCMLLGKELHTQFSKKVHLIITKRTV